MVTLIALLSSACAPNNSAPPRVQSSASRGDQTANSQNNSAPSNSESANNKSASTNTPQRSLGDPIDTSKYDDTIKNLEARLKRRPADGNLKKELSQSYTARADALTDARQYRSALGDYRRALRSDESNQRAKEGADLITGIFVSMNREVPPEGTEPPPLPFNSNDAGKTNNGTTNNSNANNTKRPLAPSANLPAH